MRNWIAFCLLLLQSASTLAQSVQLSWNKVTQDVQGNPAQIKGYDVAYGTTAGGPYPVGFSTTSTVVQVDDLTNGEHYYFVVKAVNQNGKTSDNSNQADWLVPLEDCTNLGDDDYDGLVDCEDTECPSEGGPCPLNQGVCQGTHQPCGGAAGFLDCDAQVYGQDYEETEVSCDGLDNDCDGIVDEECSCNPGQQRTCSSNQGECQEGQQVCNTQGSWGNCSGVMPSAETCEDKLDNDCDGQTDEGCQADDPDSDDSPSIDDDGLVIGGCACSHSDPKDFSILLWFVLVLSTLLRKMRRGQHI